ncbi:MAG: HD-GYP domain-containing protein, partial [bacterium]
MAEQKRLEDLDIGDYVEEGYNEKRQLLASEYPIHDQTDLNRLKEIGVVTCTVRVGGALETSEDSDATASESSKQYNDDFPAKSSLYQQAQSTYQESLERLEELMELVYDNHSKATELRDMQPLLQRFIAYVEAEPSTISCLTQIQEFDEFTYHHSLNLSLLCLLYGHNQGYDQDQLLELAFGGLVHDIGKTDFSQHLVRKENPTEEEIQQLKKHPVRGQKILKQAGFSQTFQDIALQHHLRPDGSGYPDIQSDINPMARIISVLDEYEPLLATSPERKRPHPIKAYTKLKQQFYEFNPTRDILKNIVQCMGLYPVGCLTRLSNGDIAVVM